MGPEEGGMDALAGGELTASPVLKGALVAQRARSSDELPQILRSQCPGIFTIYSSPCRGPLRIEASRRVAMTVARPRPLHSPPLATSS
jgi:hypothetical protein